MAMRVADLADLMPVVMRLPVNEFFDTYPRGDGERSSLSLQGNTQEHMRELMDCFPGVIWEKRYEPLTEWWEYNGIYQGVPINVYAVREAPRTCTAIIEERDVDEQVPVAFETRTVRKQVVVGWNCGEHATVTP